MKVYLGIDVGSVSTNVVALDEGERVLAEIYRLTSGRPIEVVKKCLEDASESLPEDAEVAGVGSTGSGRQLAGVFVGADVIKNEITAHAVAALKIVPDVKTILEIGGQDSKIILLNDGVVVDFAMNTVCAAGTGSFLDRQAARLEVPIERFGELALKAENPVRIAGRCAVFAESDMIHKQQVGHNTEDIVKGLCDALVRNYLNNVAKGKEIAEPILFQGGVASNIGMKAAFEEALGMEVVVPPHHKVMGAIGAAVLARERMQRGGPTKFRGFEVSHADYRTGSFQCDGCPNQCEIVEIFVDGALVARWGGRCDRWERVGSQAAGS